MLQEQGSGAAFLSDGFARVRIQMEPQSLELSVPLDWEINKIKCLLLRILFKLDFDLFALHHDGQEIPGGMTLREAMEADSDPSCLRGDHYPLTLVRLAAKRAEFEKYYVSKMGALVRALEASPFEPILHPAYYHTKYTLHINRIPIEGGRELILNFNQLQQMQNVIQEHRMGHQPAQDNNAGLVNVGMGLGGLGAVVDAADNGWAGMLGRGVMRFIQAISILSIAQYLLINSKIEIFIVIAALCIIYFTIEAYKNYRTNTRNLAAENRPKETIKHETVSQTSSFGKAYYRIAISLTEVVCLMVQFLVSYGLSLFPNWNVEAHELLFKGMHESIQAKINTWNQKIGEVGSNQDGPNLQEPPSEEGVGANEHEQNENLHDQ